MAQIIFYNYLLTIVPNIGTIDEVTWVIPW